MTRSTRTSKRRRQRKPPLPPAEREQQRLNRQFPAEIRWAFCNAGFAQVPTRNIQFCVAGRNGEVDGIYVLDNLVVVVEDTTAAKTKEIADHLRNKVEFYRHLRANQPETLAAFRSKFAQFADHCAKHPYCDNEYHIRFVYASLYGVESHYKSRYADIIKVFEYPSLKYFSILAKTIRRSARYEFFKFLEVELGKIGDAQSAETDKRYNALVLPEGASGFPGDHKVVSFLIDPRTLLEQAYVLRTDSWRDPDCLYQRLLIHSKIVSMRRYLGEQRRVYVNNVVATLPVATRASKRDGTPLRWDQVQDLEPIRITIPRQLNSIGIIDGQHRVFSYHEGNDEHEARISVLRGRQHLLVTGIVYPEGMSDAKRRRFEAGLFLEINDRQTRVRSNLRQAIEAIVTPFTAIAIGRSVIDRLATDGCLRACA